MLFPNETGSHLGTGIGYNLHFKDTILGHVWEMGCDVPREKASVEETDGTGFHKDGGLEMEGNENI